MHAFNNFFQGLRMAHKDSVVVICKGTVIVRRELQSCCFCACLYFHSRIRSAQHFLRRHRYSLYFYSVPCIVPQRRHSPSDSIEIDPRSAEVLSGPRCELFFGYSPSAGKSMFLPSESFHELICVAHKFFRA